MIKNKNFIQQTHFIGVLVPEEITHTLEDCRKYMNHTFGCKSGYGTPIHITLVPPFKLPEEFSTQDLIFSMNQEIFSVDNKLKFNGRIENFDAFGDRTIFAKVIPNKKWNFLRDKTLDAVLKVENNQLIFTCNNNFKEKAQNPSSGGIGLKNIQRRLHLLYPNKYRFTYEKKGNIFEVYLSINLN